MRDRNLLRVKGRAILRAMRAALDFWMYALHLQLVWESSNFTRSSVPLIESLKSNAHLIIDARNGKKLDSSATGFCFSRILVTSKASILPALQAFDRLTKTCPKLRQELTDCIRPRKYRSWLGLKIQTRASCWSVRAQG